MDEMEDEFIFAVFCFSAKNGSNRGTMAVRVMERQRAVTNTERQAGKKGERQEEQGM